MDGLDGIKPNLNTALLSPKTTKQNITVPQKNKYILYKTRLKLLYSIQLQ
jgi:hypothetical protein